MISRRSLSRRVCELLEWRSPDGKLKDADCRKALQEPDRRGRIVLPACETRFAFQRRSARHDRDLPPSDEIASSLEELGAIEVAPLTSRYAKAAGDWNDLMERHHYLGTGRLRGAQIRYLVRSRKMQWLGALSFSASTRRLKGRDRWIGWSESWRRAHLQYVVCNSRFLILPWVRVSNLASHVLGLALERLGDDWKVRYGYRPVLVETFVDPARFTAACYRAANGTRIGKTSGRTYNGQSGSQKDILVYALCDGWKEMFCSEPHIAWESKKRPLASTTGPRRNSALRSWMTRG